MFCNKCGNEIKKGEKFCSKCGNKILKKRKNIIISIGIILLVFLICGILYIGITVSKQFNKIDNNTNSEIQVNNINSNGNENNLKVDDLVKVGDFVNYIPQNTVKTYTFLGNYTGQIGLNTTVSQETLQWRVLNINDNGTIDLISSTPTQKQVTFRGALGYNNGVYLLNDFCNKIYGNSSIDATARNLNIEDIQDKMDLNVWDYHDYIYENSTKKIKYGESYNHNYSNVAQIYYPYQWKLDKGENNKIDGIATNGTMNESEQYELTTETDFRANTSIDIQQTFWTRDRMDMMSSYKKVETRRNVNDSNIYYELFYSQSPYAYWLSSRGSDCKNKTFGLRCVIEGEVSIAGIYYSSIPPEPESLRMRPVVTIPSSAIDLSSNYNEIGMWELK